MKMKFLALCLALAFVGVVHCDDDDAASPPPLGEGVEGAYEIKEKPDKAFFDLLKEVGVPKEKIEKLDKNHHMIFQLTQNPATKVYTVVKTCPTEKEKKTFSFESGKEFEHPFINGKKSKVTITITGLKMNVVRKFDDFKIVNDVTFSKEGAVANIVAKEKFKATLKLARIGMTIDGRGMGGKASPFTADA